MTPLQAPCVVRIQAVMAATTHLGSGHSVKAKGRAVVPSSCTGGGNMLKVKQMMGSCDVRK